MSFILEHYQQTLSNITQNKIYSEWYHQGDILFAEKSPYTPFYIEKTFMTTTPSCLTVLSLPFLSHGSRQRSLSYFWQDVPGESSPAILEFQQLMKQHYQSIIPNINVIPLINPPVLHIMQYFNNAKARGPLKRVIFHLTTSSTPIGDSVFLPTQNAGVQEELNIAKVLSLAGESVVLLFDFDNSGEFAHLMSGESVGFFSCSKNQKIPSSEELPNNIFSLCMLNPAKTALLWHSRRYRCFTKKPLTPLSPEFKASYSVLKSVTTNLRRIVEAMAFQILDRSTFVKIFRSDFVVSQLFTNFILASFILSSIGIVPVSYPGLPSLNNSPLWNNFNLLLDSALFKIAKNSSDDDTHFLSQVQTSLESMVLLNNRDFIPQIAFIPSLLMNKALRDKTCKILAEFADRSSESLKILTYFHTQKKLSMILKEEYSTPEIMFLTVKLAALSPSNSADFVRWIQTIVREAFSSKIPKLPLMALAIILHDCSNAQQSVAGFIPGFLKFLNSPDKDTRIWALLVIYQFPVTDGIRQEIIKYRFDPSLEVRLLVIAISGPCDEIVDEFSASVSPVLRKQLDCTISGQSSNIFDCFRVLCLSSMIDALKGHSITRTSCLPAEPSYIPVKPSLFHPVRQLSRYTHTASITSNLIHTKDDCLLFGDEDGCISISKKLIKVSNNPVKNIRIYNEYIFCSSSDCNCTVLKNNDFISTFSLDGSPHFELDEFTASMYVFEPNVSEELRSYDLRTEQKLNPIIPPSGTIRSVKPLKFFHDILAICDDKIELIDLRTDEPVLSLPYDGEIFDFCVLDEFLPSFVACTKSSALQVFDIRNVDKKVSYISRTGDVEPLSFDVHPLTTSAAIGSGSGITLLNLDTSRALHYPPQMGWFSPTKQVPQITQVSFMHNKFGLDVVQSYKEIVTLE